MPYVGKILSVIHGLTSKTQYLGDNKCWVAQMARVSFRLFKIDLFKYKYTFQNIHYLKKYLLLSTF